MKKHIIFALLIIFIALLSLSLFACQTEDDAENPDECKVEFTDALGRTVSVSKNPERVAALLGSFADVWQLAGGELCAAADDAWEDFELALDSSVINLGGAHSPSLELLISAKPDFVIASASTKSNLEMREVLEAMGIAVAYFDVDSFEDYLSMLNILTDITGRRDLYEKNGLDVKAEIDLIKSEYKNAALPSEERKILLLRASSSSVKAKSSRGTILGEMLADIGCINIADSDKSLLENLSIEKIIREEPYHIFVVTMGSDTDGAKKMLSSLINESSAWKTLLAVKENRIHIMDKRLFNLKPNARWAESYRVLYETLTKA